MERSTGERGPRDVIDRANVITKLTLSAILDELLAILRSGKLIEQKLLVLRVHIGDIQ